jgi:regulatory protein
MSNPHDHMPGIITSITVQKKNKNRFNIFINGQYSFSLNRSLAESLKPDDQLTQNKIKALKQTDEQDTAYSRALFYLKFRPRTRMEIERYLKGKNFSSVATTSTLSRLEGNGYINDFEFARLWIENRLRFKPKGSYALKAELRKKGIDDQIIIEVLMDFNETESAWAAISPRLTRLEKLEKNEFNKKIYSFLSYRGFDYSTCKQICDQAWEQQTLTAEKK